MTIITTLVSTPPHSGIFFLQTLIIYIYIVVSGAIE